MADQMPRAAAEQFQRIDRAFRAGDLDALRASVADPAVIPNGPMPDTIGSCLVYAIYHSPRSFIRTLLEIGADPNAPADDGFPPLIAALSGAGSGPRAGGRPDLDAVIRVLLRFGADPDVRGINDYTALHMAVAERQPLAVQRLLDAGANPALRTRIDDCATPLEMARAAGLADIAALLEASHAPRHERLRPGLTQIWDIAGTGTAVARGRAYDAILRLWLGNGDPVRWTAASGPEAARLEDDGETLMTRIRVHRGSLINGLFYGIEGMRVGGTRKLDIAPHLAYADRGVPGVIPPGARLVAEITLLDGES